MGCLSMIVVDGNAARFPYRDKEIYDLKKWRVLSAQSAWRDPCLHNNLAKQVCMSSNTKSSQEADRKVGGSSKELAEVDLQYLHHALFASTHSQVLESRRQAKLIEIF